MKLADLKKVISGDVITPESALYATAQNTLFAKGAPALVLRPKTNEDVALGIRHAQENKLKLSVRSGGHSGAGFGTNTGGVVIELSYMEGVDLIDKTKHTVRVGGGAHWGDVAKKLYTFGLAVSSGDTLSVGVGGLTLGGGIGWMVRKYGLAIDSLVAAEVVLPDGRVVRASADKEPDLFWALRGGGGNFGVVTSFEFAAHPVGKVYAGVIVYPLENLVKIIGGWRDGMRSAPEELTTMLVTMPSFMGMPPSAIVMCRYMGDKNHAEEAIKPFRQLGKTLSDNVERKEYYEVLEEAHPQEV